MTLEANVKELNKAWKNLIIEVSISLRLDKLLLWLTKKLEK